MSWKDDVTLIKLGRPPEQIMTDNARMHLWKIAHTLVLQDYLIILKQKPWLSILATENQEMNHGSLMDLKIYRNSLGTYVINSDVLQLSSPGEYIRIRHIL